MRPNWFLAFPFEGSFVPRLTPPPAHFRLFAAADVHLTLSFLGACGEAAARAALAALDAELARHPQPPLAVSLAEVVAMGPRPAYSALSALLADGRAETEACIGRLRDLCSDAAGGRRERRAPKAHVTVARPSRRASEDSRKDGLAWAASLDLSRVRTSLDRVALYTWADSDRRESLFQVVAERTLC